jgi:Ca-activated chloride channel family protein
MKLTPAAGFAIGATYGFPGEDLRAAALEVSTVFLSRRRGALLLRLDPPQGGLTGLGVQGTLSYEPVEGGARQRELRLAYGGQPLDDRGTYFVQPSVGKAVALAQVMAATREAAERYKRDQAGAEKLLAQALVRFRADAAALGDSALDPVLQMLEELDALMKRGAPQGTLYGRT